MSDTINIKQMQHNLLAKYHRKLGLTYDAIALATGMSVESVRRNMKGVQQSPVILLYLYEEFCSRFNYTLPADLQEFFDAVNIPTDIYPKRGALPQ